MNSPGLPLDRGGSTARPYIRARYTLIYLLSVEEQRGKDRCEEVLKILAGEYVSADHIT